jgi:hypothetical protein
MKGETKQGDSVIRASFRNIEAGDTPALHSNSLPRIGNFTGQWSAGPCHAVTTETCLSTKCFEHRPCRCAVYGKAGASPRRHANGPGKWAW